MRLFERVMREGTTVDANGNRCRLDLARARISFGVRCQGVVMRETSHTTRRVLFWVFIAFVVLLGAALIALQTEKPRAYVLETITNHLNKTLAGKVEVERVSGSLLWGATLHDVALRDARGNPVLDVDEVHVNYSLPMLFEGQLDLRSVGLVKPHLIVRRYTDGVINVTTLVKPAKPRPAGTPPRPFALDQYEVSNGTVTYVDETKKSGASGRELEARNVDATGSLHVEGGKFSTHLDKLSLATDAGTLAKSVPVAADDVTVVVERGHLHVAAPQARVDKTSRLENISVDRNVASGDQTKKAATYVGRVQRMTLTPRLAKAISPGLNLAAPVTIHGGFHGPTDELAVQGDATAAHGSTVGFHGTVSTSPVTFDLSVRGDNVDPAHWIVLKKAPPMHFSVRGTLLGSRASAHTWRVRTHLNATNVAVGDYQARSLVLGPRQRFTLEFRRSPEPGRPTQINADGAVQVSGLEAKSFTVSAVQANVDMTHAGSSNHGDVRAGLDRLTVGKHAFDSGRVTLNLKSGDAFALTARAVPSIAPQFPLVVQTDGSETNKFKNLKLSTLELGRPGLMWTTRNPSTVVIGDQTVTINSMVLYGPGTSVRLDGTYPRQGTLAAIVERLGLAGVKGVLQNEQLLQDLPQQIQKQLPNELKKNIPEELQKQLPGELQKQLPQDLKQLPGIFN